jgi:lia operon protein LiaG
MRRPALLLSFVIPAVLTAQQPEKISLDGREVAIYNLAGTLKVEGGTGDRVVVEITRGGRDASRLKLETGDVRGRMALRVRYPEDRIYYAEQRWHGHTSFSINDDGTFGDRSRDRNDNRHRIEISSDDGLDAHADLHVIVPKGKTLYLRQGVGETTIENIDGQLDVDVSSAHTRVSHINGALTLETGSGGVEVSDVNGDVTLDAGSGGTTIDGIRGGRLRMDIGSGSLRGHGIDVTELVGDIGSGGARLAGVKTPKLHLSTGSGGSDIELLSPADDVSIGTGSGGVTLHMPASTSASVDIRTGSGGVDSDFDVKVSRVERHALHGTIGSGTGHIKIESGSGSVHLLKN